MINLSIPEFLSNDLKRINSKNPFSEYPYTSKIVRLVRYKEYKLFWDSTIRKEIEDVFMAKTLELFLKIFINYQKDIYIFDRKNNVFIKIISLRKYLKRVVKSLTINEVKKILFILNH